jgi:hypothetical protein
MSAFWGYASADTFAILVIGGASALCLICARLFLTNYNK